VVVDLVVVDLVEVDLAVVAEDAEVIKL
jgi:hypothetical protein